MTQAQCEAMIRAVLPDEGAAGAVTAKAPRKTRSNPPAKGARASSTRPGAMRTTPASKKTPPRKRRSATQA
jgi:hypothetical protein